MGRGRVYLDGWSLLYMVGEPAPTSEMYILIVI